MREGPNNVCLLVSQRSYLSQASPDQLNYSSVDIVGHKYRYYIHLMPHWRLALTEVMIFCTGARYLQLPLSCARFLEIFVFGFKMNTSQDDRHRSVDSKSHLEKWNRRSGSKVIDIWKTGHNQIQTIFGANLLYFQSVFAHLLPRRMIGSDL